MTTISILDDYQRAALDSADWSRVRAHHSIRVFDQPPGNEDELVAQLAASEIIVVMRERTPFPASVLTRLPALQLLVTTGSANAAIDLVAAQAQGVVVSGTSSSGNGVPELTMGMIIALTRNIAREDAALRAGGWQHTIGPGLAGLTLGVLGLGRIGTPVATLAQAFGMLTTAWSPNLTPERAAAHGVRAVSETELFAGSDVITVHMPLSDRSRGLVGARELALMKPTAYLVNTSRGAIVDESALVTVLRDRGIAGAALDVYEQEPLPRDHPLRSLPNTLLLPHLGYVTTDAYRHWYGEVVEDIEAWTAGQPIRTL